MDIIYEAYIKSINESITAKQLIEIFKNRSDWGDMIDYVRLVKDYNIEVVDTWYIDEKRALENLIKSWTDNNGTYAKYFKNEYGIKFKLIDSFSQTNAEGRYKKLTKDGIVGIIIKIV